jgi:hypothetical protein
MSVRNFAEIELFIQYGVKDEAREDAVVFARRYARDRIGLLLLAEFYTTLPEAREEAVVRIAKLTEQRGVMLFVVSTVDHHYLAIVSDDLAQILGEYAGEEVPDDVLAHFGYRNMEEFRQSCPPVTALVEYGGGVGSSGLVCPACGVGEGELHFLGCPVEICPWCDGQLNKCNCRFERLQLEELDDEAQLEALQDLLEEKGRIPYKGEQQLAYPGTSAGLDSGRES